MTDTEATPAETVKKETSPEQEANKIVVRALARALARMDAGKGDLKTVWTEGRAKYIDEGRKLAKALRKERVTLTVEPQADATPNPDD